MVVVQNVLRDLLNDSMNIYSYIAKMESYNHEGNIQQLKDREEQLASMMGYGNNILCLLSEKMYI